MQVTLAEAAAPAPVPLGSGRTRRQFGLQRPVLPIEDHLAAGARGHVDYDRREKVLACIRLTGIRDHENHGILSGVQIAGLAVDIEDLASESGTSRGLREQRVGLCYPDGAQGARSTGTGDPIELRYSPGRPSGRRCDPRSSRSHGGKAGYKTCPLYWGLWRFIGMKHLV